MTNSKQTNQNTTVSKVEEVDEVIYHMMENWNLGGSTSKNDYDHGLFFIDKNSTGNTVENGCLAIKYYNNKLNNNSLIAEKTNNGLKIIDFDTCTEEHMTPNMLQTILTRKPFAWYYGHHDRKVKSEDGKTKVVVETSPGQPNLNVFKSLCSLPPNMKDMIPVYDTTHPGILLTFDGNIITQHGYYEEYKTILMHDYDDIPMPDTPTYEDVQEARDTFFRAYGTFMFKQENNEPLEESVAYQNTIFSTFLAALRPVYNGPMPIVVVNKNSERVGGTLLLQGMAILAHSDMAARVAFNTSSAENEKTFLAKIREAPLMVIIDNVTHDSDWVSPALLSATTGGENSAIEFRLLGQTKMITVKPRSVYAVDGIGVKITADVCGRVIVINMESPEAWQNIKFKEEKNILLKRMEKMHPEIIKAMCVMIRYWMSLGMPEAKEPNGNISEYSDLYKYIGGVMSACGYNHYLDNMKEVQTISNDKDFDGTIVVNMFYEKFGTNKVRSNDILKLLRTEVNDRKNNPNHDVSSDLSDKILMENDMSKIDTMSQSSIGKKLEPFVDIQFFGTDCCLHKGRDSTAVYYQIQKKGEVVQSTIPTDDNQGDSLESTSGTLMEFV